MGFNETRAARCEKNVVTTGRSDALREVLGRGKPSRAYVMNKTRNSDTRSLIVALVQLAVVALQILSQHWPF